MYAVLYSKKDRLWKIADYAHDIAENGVSQRLSQPTVGLSACYQSPEIFGDGKVTNAVDIWSLGCIFYELVTGEKAFGGMRDMQAYCDKRRPLFSISR